MCNYIQSCTILPFATLPVLTVLSALSRFAPPITQVRELSRRQEEAERKKVEQANAEKEAKKAVAAHVKQQVRTFSVLICIFKPIN